MGRRKKSTIHGKLDFWKRERLEKRKGSTWRERKWKRKSYSRTGMALGWLSWRIPTTTSNSRYSPYVSHFSTSRTTLSEFTKKGGLFQEYSKGSVLCVHNLGTMHEIVLLF